MPLASKSAGEEVYRIEIEEATMAVRRAATFCRRRQRVYGKASRRSSLAGVRQAVVVLSRHAVGIVRRCRYLYPGTGTRVPSRLYRNEGVLSTAYSNLNISGVLVDYRYEYCTYSVYGTGKVTLHCSTSKYHE